MLLMTFLSLLPHLLSSTVANKVGISEVVSNYGHIRHNKDDIDIRQNNSKTTNYKLVERKGAKNENTQNLRIMKNEIVENMSKIVLTTPKKLKKGLLVVPGLGREDRLHIVLHNIRLLVQGGTLLPKSEKEEIERKEMNGENNVADDKKYENLWDCVIYVYIDRPENADDILADKFWNKSVSIDYIENYCSIEVNPGYLVSKNLRMVQPAIIQSSYEYVFILLDDARLLPMKSNVMNSNSGSSSQNHNDNNNTNNNNTDNNDINHNDNIRGHKHKRGSRNRNKESFDLHKILRIMEFNNLTVSSPFVSQFFHISTLFVFSPFISMTWLKEFSN